MPDVLARQQLNNPLFSDRFKTDPELEHRYLRSILETHKDKNFVQRILNYGGPNLSPSVDLRGTGYGDYGTHLMVGNSHPNGGQMAYPQIVDRGKGLELLSSQDAYNHALTSGEYIPFSSAEEVNWFGQNYKKGSDYGGNW